MTDKEKLSYIKAKFANYISGIETLAQFKVFLKNITKAKLIIGLKNTIQKEIDARGQHVTDKQTEIDSLMEFKNQLEDLLK